MTTWAHIQTPQEPASLYARPNDFCGILPEGLNGLYQLSFLLTGNLEQAERCLVVSLEDCAAGKWASGESATFWTKSIIVENAIRTLRPRPSHSHPSLPAPVFPYIGQLSSGPDGHFKVEAILALEDFERFVFVISVLEQYSAYECALLLESSVSDVREARTRALEELTDSLHLLVPDHEVVAQEAK